MRSDFLCDDEKLDYCKEMMAKAEKMGKKILLPVDAVTIMISRIQSTDL